MYPGTVARRTPDKPAVIMAATGETLSYRQLDERSNQFAHLLRHRGLGRGDHVAVLLDNHVRYLEVCWGAQRAGQYYTPVNWHLTTSEVEYIVRDSGARVLVAGARFLPVLHDILAAGTGPDTVLLLDGSAPGTESYEQVVGAMPSTPIPDECEGFDMIYSSGTTGRPKGGSRALLETHPTQDDPRKVAFFELFGLGSETTYLMPGAPLYHGAPLRFTMGVHRLGGTNVIMDRFDPLEALAAIERHGVTHSQWVPTMFVRLLRLSAEERARFDLSSHCLAIHAAAPCPPTVKEEMMEWWGPILCEYYGASEGGGITVLNPADWAAHRGSVGRAVLGKLHIVGEDGDELPAEEEGVVYFERGLPIAYHNDPDKTASAHDVHGWTTVGDIGRVDADGYLYLTDRKDHMIISGGVNIYPQEIEAVLIQHPAVADVAVIGVPNAEFGEEVRAIVQPLDPTAAGTELAEELIAFCRRDLAGYKCPRVVEFEAELPRAPSGKLYKRRLRARYWEGHETVIQCQPVADARTATTGRAPSG